MTSLLPPVYFYQYTFQIIILPIGFFSNVFLLHTIYRRRLYKNLSSNLILHLVCWCFASTFIFSHSIYIARFGRTDAAQISGYGVFITGTLQAAGTWATTVSVTFITIERIAILNSPKNRALNFVLPAILLAVFGSIILFILVCFVEYPVPEMTGCISSACILQKTKGLCTVIPKLCCASLNAFLAIVFSYKVASYRRNQTSFQQRNFRRANLLAAFAIFVELLLNWTPNLLWTILYISEASITSSLGPFITSFFSIDCFLSAFMYRFVIMKKSITVDVSVSSTFVK